MALVAVLCVGSLNAQNILPTNGASDEASPADRERILPAAEHMLISAGSLPVTAARADIIWNNGPFITHPGQGPDGADVAAWPVSGMIQTGANMNKNSGYSMADDFVLEQSAIIDAIEFFTYQTGSGFTSTITGVYVQIWFGAPNGGGYVVWGDLTTNRMESTRYTNINRVSTDLQNTDRPVMNVIADIGGLLLEAGTYWVEVATTGNVVPASGPWANPVSILGELPSGNALQKVSAGWKPWIDESTSDPNAGTKAPFDLPFAIYGTVINVIDCEPPTNLTAIYIEECAAELKWNAPAKGNFSYTVYRDGEEIATVETESYTDNTLEPTLNHSWAVRVTCDGYSPTISTMLPFCKEPDCEDNPKNLTVIYEEDCSAAILSWNPPTELLWDNTRETNSGYPSYRALYETYSHLDVIADDFDLPEGEIWYISEVSIGGFHNAASGSYMCPNYLGVEIWNDNGNDLPGSLVAEFPKLLPMSGNFNSKTYVVLPKIVELYASGKYWISCYGTYDDVFMEEMRFYVYHFDEPIGANMCRWKEPDGDWAVHNNGVSMYFRLHGSKTADPKYFNIYRDGVLIEENVTENTYTDNDFDPTKPHRWSVKKVCSDGIGVSAPTIFPLPFCSNAVIENAATSFTIFPNPSSNYITIATENNLIINTVEVYNILGQTVISKSNIFQVQTNLNVSNLNSGIYFVRVASENGISVRKFVKQ